MQINQILGDYKLLELIGKGGQAEVYKALDMKLKRFVAVKVFHANQKEYRGKLASFKLEARLVSSLNHPNICKVYGLFEEENQTFTVMEYLHGKNLFEIAYGKPLEIKNAVAIALKIAEALIAAHAKGIIHRDIKPRNVLVTDDGRVVVLDFGSAKLLENKNETSGSETALNENLSEFFYEDIAEDLFLTVDGLPFGTPASSPPEMALGNPTDERSDVYSIGIILYLLLTGTYPFLAKTIKEVRQKVINDEPVSVASARKAGEPVSSELSAIVHRALQKHPDNRFQTMTEIRDALLSVSEEIGEDISDGDSRLSEKIVPIFAESESRIFQKKRVIILSATALFIIIGVAIWYFI